MPERRIPEGEINTGGGSYDCPAVAEGQKTLIAMVFSHAAVAHSAERQFVVDDVHDGIVDASSA